MVATAVYGVLTVCVVALVAVGGLVAVQRLVPAARRQEHNDVAGFIYAVVGVIYAVLLALMVIAVWEEHEAAKATVREEANELADVFWLAHRLPEPEGPRLQELALSYARVVAEEEWPLMVRGGRLQSRGVGPDGRDAPQHAKRGGRHPLRAGALRTRA